MPQSLLNESRRVTNRRAKYIDKKDLNRKGEYSSVGAKCMG